MLLQGEVIRYHPYKHRHLTASSTKAVIAWGVKTNTRQAAMLAERLQRPLWRLEDGFISYLGHPQLGDRRFSVIVDKAGIYYDGTKPSDLENLLNDPCWFNPALAVRSEQLLSQVRTHHISKYNHEPVGHKSVPKISAGKRKVLVVDQTFGDCSVQYGQADADSFTAMLQSALQENPDSDVWVKVHPDVVLGKKQGYFPVENGCLKGIDNPRVKVLAHKVNGQSLFQHVEKVYVVTSQLGFEALLHGKKVVCFGLPFYSGWGLTDDRLNCHRRTQTHTLTSLFAAACLLYPRYIDPETGQRCELDDILPLIVQQRQYQVPQVDTLYALGFSLWKRAFIKEFVGGLAKQVIFVRNERALRRSMDKVTGTSGLLLWGQRALPKGEKGEKGEKGGKEGVMPFNRCWRMEDGFIRSCGLGADLRRPASLVLDDRGIYYDATLPSRLEHLLETAKVTPEQLARGEAVRAQLLGKKISKYNLADADTAVFSGARAGQRRVLVTGQVDSDASLKYGSPRVHRNIDLLKQVHEWYIHNNIDVYLVYKPHPDVVQAGRQGHVPRAEALKYVDKVVTNASIFHALNQCDELHVMTSQAGFEALLQEKTVHCWGMPFYAGWGLTQDHLVDGAISQRRQTSRTLAELVYLVLCVYPRYVHWQTRRFTTVERVIEALASERKIIRKGDDGWLGRKRRKARFLVEAICS